MNITIERSTFDGIKTCSGELFECGEYQFCIAWVDGHIHAIELSTGCSVGKSLNSLFIDDDESKEYCIAEVKSIVRDRIPYMASALQKAIDVNTKLGIPYSLNTRVKKEKNE